MGFCFGVRDALAIAHALPAPQQVTIHGQLVHNEAVAADLARRGFVLLDEADRSRHDAGTEAVLITAHGISNAQRAQIQASGHRLIDTTCPLVRRAHEAALRLAGEDRFVLVIGRRGHVEVVGLTGDLPHSEVIESADEVCRYEHDRLGVVCQTTSADHDVRLILGAIHQANPAADIAFIDTVCQPTRDRQEAVEELLDQATVLVVVGGRHSNNTLRLLDRARVRGVPGRHVQGPADLDRDWFSADDLIGLTAGTSTPDTLIDAVHAALLDMTGHTPPDTLGGKPARRRRQA